MKTNDRSKRDINKDIEQKVSAFYNRIPNDKHHRYRSWEHCYQYFLNNKKSDDIASLHLAFYLASWGMYRGSSFLLQKDYKIHHNIVQKLLKHKHLQNIDFSSITSDKDEIIQKVINLLEQIKCCYPKNIELINGEIKKVNVTDTLVTKIMLGTLGCTPAYDSYVVKGMRKSGLKYSSTGRKNLWSVIKFYKDHFDGFEEARKDINPNIKSKSKVNYPAMKLVDMYFWQVGFENDKKKTK